MDDDLERSPPECRLFEWHYLKRRCHSVEHTFPAKDKFPSAVRAVIFTPDDKGLAVALDNGEVRMIDVATGQPTHPPLHRPARGSAYSLAFCPDKTDLVLVAAGTGWTAKPERYGIPGRVLIWNRSRGEKAESISDDLFIRGEEDVSRSGQRVACHPRRSAAFPSIAFAGEAGTVKLWDRMAGKLVVDPGTKTTDRSSASRSARTGGCWLPQAAPQPARGRAGR